jgi:RNA recognition motif-containing protein
MKNIFVGNLTSGTTPEAIRSLFEPLGEVCSFKLMTDKETGQSRGFAFVEMTEAEAEQAIAALNGKIVDGQAINVREGREKLHRGVAARGGSRRSSEPPSL